METAICSCECQIEAFNPGWGKQETFKHARAYAEAGADAILPHSKSPMFGELKGFAEAWDSLCPHIAVPTTYASITEWDLAFAGFDLVIFADQALRAAVKAMRDSLATLNQEAGPSARDLRTRRCSRPAS